MSNISTTPLRASSTSGDVTFITSIPSMTVVLQDATNLGIGRGSFSDPLLTFTKQVRHLPPIPLNSSNNTWPEEQYRHRFFGQPLISLFPVRPLRVFRQWLL